MKYLLQYVILSLLAFITHAHASESSTKGFAAAQLPHAAIIATRAHRANPRDMNPELLPTELNGYTQRSYTLGVMRPSPESSPQLDEEFENLMKEIEIQEGQNSTRSKTPNNAVRQEES